MNSSNNSCSVSNGSGYDYFGSFTCSCLIKADGFPPICLNGLLLVVATCAILVYAVYKFACLIRPCRTVGMPREKYISLFVIIFLECFACCWEFLRPSMNTWLFIEFLHIMTQYYIALHMTPLGYKLPRRFRVLQVLVCALFGVMVALGYTLMEGSKLMCFYQAPWILLIAMELLILFGLSFGTLGVVECATKTRYDSIPRCQRKSTQLS